MPFDFSKLPWRQWLQSVIHAGIWRLVNSLPFWIVVLVMGATVLLLAWLAGGEAKP